ncbi:helix-turn-helix domain-containing protein [Mesorhizobium sp. M6A.T.Cr.TU.017.01.1.1]|uniref:helix-turn-helix domain-containing protein n=1 Tax=Mesorhizobium sp. M6A.T.Cr.TU.017.01.1.1 TaxID=2496774 RepID=UPI000FD4275D|nr:helix-turn-helix domain-containing protein [Mesorhizobium sp. M6A.T.Cr.TU.017.01.1.1]RUU98601.1 helix-turn-helix domain-containing protein [Mesorhizobium sp. M6A.T.Cr.TU.017.01.1.1]
MSHAAVEWGRRQHPGDPVAKNVLIALCEHLNGKTGQCNPRVATICHDTDYSDRAVRKALRTLEKLGLIRIEPGHKAGNSYQICGDFNRHAMPDNSEPERNLTGTSADLCGTSCRSYAAPRAGSIIEPELEPERTVVRARAHANGSAKKPSTHEAVKTALLAALSQERAEAVIEHRIAILKKLTPYAARLLAAQFSLAPIVCGLSPDEAADAMIEHGWRGFKPDWINNARDRDKVRQGQRSQNIGESFAADYREAKRKGMLS